jgi:hypothetical protein
MATNTHILSIHWETQPPHRRPDLNTKDERLNAKKCETNPIDTPACHPERRAAEQSAAAQSRGTCSNSIPKGDSKQTNPTATPKIRNEPNLPPQHPASHRTTPITRNEPNSTSPTAKRRKPTAKNTKRTQFAPTVTLPHPKKSKRTQFPYPPYRWRLAGFSTPTFCKTNPFPKHADNCNYLSLKHLQQ